jgi:hypothetical protein
MKTIGIMIIVTGLIVPVYTGFGFITKPDEIHIDKMEITKNQGYGLVWSPIIGIVIIAIGGSILMVGPNNDLPQNKYPNGPLTK